MEYAETQLFSWNGCVTMLLVYFVNDNQQQITPSNIKGALRGLLGMVYTRMLAVCTTLRIHWICGPP